MLTSLPCHIYNILYLNHVTFIFLYFSHNFCSSKNISEPVYLIYLTNPVYLTQPNLTFLCLFFIVTSYFLITFMVLRIFKTYKSNLIFLFVVCLTCRLPNVYVTLPVFYISCIYLSCNLPSQSRTMVSSSVQAGEAAHEKPMDPSPSLSISPKMLG